MTNDQGPPTKSDKDTRLRYCQGGEVMVKDHIECWCILINNVIILLVCNGGASERSEKLTWKQIMVFELNRLFIFLLTLIDLPYLLSCSVINKMDDGRHSKALHGNRRT